ncbi:MAG: GWxTD domain-containing protein [Candidatus Cloacimonadaceae bacterium]
MKIRGILIFLIFLFPLCLNLAAQNVIVNKYPDKSTMYILLPYELFIFAAETSIADYQMSVNLTDNAKKQVYQGIISISVQDDKELKGRTFLEDISFSAPAGQYKLVLLLHNRKLGDKKEKQFQITVPADSSSVNSLVVGETKFYKFYLTDLTRPIKELLTCKLIVDTYQQCDSLALAVTIDGKEEYFPIPRSSGYTYDLLPLMEKGKITSLKIITYLNGAKKETRDVLNAAVGEFDQLYSLKDQLLQIKYIATQNEWKTVKSIAEKDEAKAIEYFWSLHDNSPNDERNDLRDMFQERVKRADELFSVHKNIPGWKTDRGRIYIIKGPPDEMSEEVYPVGRPPYILWYYYKENLIYRFEDRSGYGNYTLQAEISEF